MCAVESTRNRGDIWRIARK